MNTSNITYEKSEDLSTLQESNSSGCSDVIEWEKMRENLGTEAMIKEITAEFLSENTKRMEKLKGAVDLHDVEQIIFYAPKIQAEDASEKSEGLGQWNAKGEALIGSIVDGSFLAFNSVGLKGLKSVKLSVFFSNNYDYEGDVELREGQVTGPIIGKTHLKYFNKDKGALTVYDIPVYPQSEQNDLILLFKNEKNKAQYIANANWILLNY